MTRELARELGRTALAILADLVERTRFVEERLQRDAARGVAAGRAHRELDLDLLGCARITIFAHMSECRAREDASAVQVHQAVDAEQPLRLATHTQEIVD